MSPLIHIKRSFLKIPKEIVQPEDKIVSTSTTEPSPDCQQLVKRSEVGRQKNKIIKKKKKSINLEDNPLTKVESRSWSGEMSPIEVEGENLGQ